MSRLPRPSFPDSHNTEVIFSIETPISEMGERISANLYLILSSDLGAVLSRKDRQKHQILYEEVLRWLEMENIKGKERKMFRNKTFLWLFKKEEKGYLFIGGIGFWFIERKRGTVLVIDALVLHPRHRELKNLVALLKGCVKRAKRLYPNLEESVVGFCVVNPKIVRLLQKLQEKGKIPVLENDSLRVEANVPCIEIPLSFLESLKVAEE